ncbi:amidohydrolase family protein [Azohydromonas caseinilytica]|uniref:Amidohydrolase family protein n=1 Tax=Azohydromonas caseinilytica TaxID=2728836 RepID=A0A848F4M0_9BURK|nr:amidohydrolase family protein [Azohydromonas caseinilytica]NML14028.1 amidohydrolase family protein [Azohydromonas caseinilytica]
MREPGITRLSDSPEDGGWDCHVHVFDIAAPVQPGHYVPAHRPLHEIEARAAGHGIRHLVLVQPSVYGSDNSVMLRALQASAGRHRGVAVVEPDVSDATLDELHAAGVRGIRFNLVSPVGHQGDAGDALRSLAPRLRRRGWHVQWYARAGHLAGLATLQREMDLPFVLDHLAGLHAALPAEDPAWAAAAALAEGGAWIKLSGWYRLQSVEPYPALWPAIERAAALFGDRCVWGSDWPHTSFAPDALPTYDSTLAPLRRVLGDAATAHLLRAHAPALYLQDPTS